MLGVYQEPMAYLDVGYTTAGTSCNCCYWISWLATSGSGTRCGSLFYTCSTEELVSEAEVIMGMKVTSLKSLPVGSALIEAASSYGALLVEPA